MTTVPARHHPRRLWLLLCWLVVLGAAVWMLTRAGAGPLAAPPASDTDALRGWYAERSPPEALLAGLRLLALALGWYLLGATFLGALARLLGAARLVAAADVLTIPAVRGLLHATLGVGLAAASVVALPGVATPARAGAAHAAAPATLTVALGDGGSLRAAEEIAATEAPAKGHQRPAHTDPPPLRGLPVEESLGEHQPPALDLPIDGPAALEGLAAGSAGHEGQDADGDSPAAHTVGAGDHLWGIAEEALASGWGRAPADPEIVPYWLELVDLNRDRLPDPDNPDLIHPGLRIALPDLPAPP